MKVVNTRKPTVKLTSSRRLFSRVYYVSTNSCSVSICKIAFLRIYSISNGRLARAVKAAQSEGGTPHCDQRGRHTPVNKTSDAVIGSIKEHIESFPKYTSHYSRKDNPNRHYLSSELTIAKMYYLYKDFCEEQDITPIASQCIYRKTFNESYNLHFGRWDDIIIEL